MLYKKAILFTSANLVEVEEISDEEAEGYLGDSTYSHSDGTGNIDYKFAVGKTEEEALQKLYKGLEDVYRGLSKACQEYHQMLSAVKRVLDNGK